MGRLGKADAAVELLCTSDSNRAESLAVALDEVNQERQELTKRMAKRPKPWRWPTDLIKTTDAV